jgi:NAD(P)-dependent dehydrogenase (short-subunit alcohol dehydrogenase family)
VFPSNMTAFGLHNDKDNAMAGAHPMGRIGTAEDVSSAACLCHTAGDGMLTPLEGPQIAGLLLFLVSRAGAHVSGALIPIDGGALLAGRGYSRL